MSVNEFTPDISERLKRALARTAGVERSSVRIDYVYEYTHNTRRRLLEDGIRVGTYFDVIADEGVSAETQRIAALLTVENINHEIDSDTVLKESLPTGAEINLLEIPNQPDTDEQDLTILIAIAGGSGVVVLLCLLCVCRRKGKRHRIRNRSYAPVPQPSRVYWNGAPNQSVIHKATLPYDMKMIPPLHRAQVDTHPRKSDSKKVLNYALDLDTLFTQKHM
jgi:hypothetical protein